MIVADSAPLVPTININWSPISPMVDDTYIDTVPEKGQYILSWQYQSTGRQSFEGMWNKIMYGTKQLRRKFRSACHMHIEW